MTTTDEVMGRTPPNILEFLSREEHQLLVSLHNMREEMEAVARIEGLYSAAMSFKAVHENDFVVFQLLTFSHYQFLSTLACQMRCHLSEAFASTRAAIDATLIAAYIIKDRASQVAYAKREKPFDNFARHLGNMIKDGKALPHPLMAALIDQYKKISSFAVHADVGSFIHRVRESSENGKPLLGVEYFQFARDDNERKLHTYSLLHTFVMILDVFSELLIDEQKTVPEEWKKRLHALGGAIERRAGVLREAILKEHGNANSDSVGNGPVDQK